MRKILDRAKAWAKANPKKAVAVLLALPTALGATISPEFREVVMDAGPVVINILLGV